MLFDESLSCRLCTVTIRASEGRMREVSVLAIFVFVATSACAFCCCCSVTVLPVVARPSGGWPVAPLALPAPRRSRMPAAPRLTVGCRYLRPCICLILHLV